MENIEEIFNEILMYDVQEALKYSSDGFKKSGNPEYLIIYWSWIFSSRLL